MRRSKGHSAHWVHPSAARPWWTALSVRADLICGRDKASALSIIDMSDHQISPKEPVADEQHNAIERLPGVSSLHDLHIWPMSATETALTCHLVMPGGAPGNEFLTATAAGWHDHDLPLNLALRAKVTGLRSI